MAGHVPPKKKLFGRTVPPNRKLFGGTLPPNRKLFCGTVPPNRKLFSGTVPPNSLPLHLFVFFKARNGDKIKGLGGKKLYQICKEKAIYPFL